MVNLKAGSYNGLSLYSPPAFLPWKAESSVQTYAALYLFYMHWLLFLRSMSVF